jgi:DMSO/TMAO reductase YedYZ heme-binding membrane subunit
VWCSMLVVVALWVAGGGVQGLAQAGASLTSLGRLTGLVASDLLLVQVLLMARIPLVERTFGQDELARRHRWVGFWSFSLVVVHIVAITVGYAAATPGGLWATIVDLVVNYPGMLLAVAGTVALVGVIVTSVRAARARLRYESWHLLHLYAYLGLGLALPHQLWTGKDFLTSPAATVYWWTLWAAAAASVLFWRVGQPLWRSLRHQLVVEQVRAENGGTRWPDPADHCRAPGGWVVAAG